MLTDQPSLIRKGITAWRNPGNLFTSVLLHFTADDDGATEEQRRAGMDEDDFKREHGLDFSSFAGKPVYPGFNSKLIKEVFASEDFTVLRGMDFGYHRPGAVYAQIFGNQLWLLGEVMGQDQTLDRFITDIMLPYEAAVFSEFEPKFATFADPAGRQVSDKSQYTSFSILSNHGIHPIARKSEINEGLTIIRQKMADLSFLVHPRCRILIEGFKGGYCYPEVDEGKPEALLPHKDGYYDHLQDAFRYLVINNLSVVVRKEKPKPEELPPGLQAVLDRAKNRATDTDFGDWF